MFTNPYDIAILPVIVGLVQVLKSLGLASQWAPIASIILGLIGGFFYVAPGDTMQAVISGLALGLASMGLWSGPKATARALRTSGK